MGEVLLLDIGVVILSIGPGPGEVQSFRLRVPVELIVDEGVVVVRVDPPPGEGGRARRYRPWRAFRYCSRDRMSILCMSPYPLWDLGNILRESMRIIDDDGQFRHNSSVHLLKKDFPRRVYQTPRGGASHHHVTYPLNPWVSGDGHRDQE
jgi:hypothetical protein